MSFMINEGEMTIMEDGSLYQVVKSFLYENEEYVIIKKSAETLEEAVEDSIENVDLCKVLIDNNEVYLDKLTDETLISKILETQYPV